jgi:hypothetical protein
MPQQIKIKLRGGENPYVVDDCADQVGLWASLITSSNVIWLPSL